MKQLLLVLFMSVNIGIAQAACLDDDALKNLQKAEAAYLSKKIPPAFKHGLASGEITVSVTNTNDAAACEAVVTVMVPEQDIEEATAVLDAQPAKKIMLAAQGYALPTQTNNQATFGVDATTLEVSQTDYLQTGDLGKLRANIELMYAFITQKRAAIQTGQSNAEAWPKQVQEKVVSTCSQNNTAAVCGCLSSEYQKVIPAKQMEYILNVEENPYAAATGANESFYQLKTQAKQTCAG